MQVLYVQDESINMLNGKYYHSKSQHFFDKYRYGLNGCDALIICCWILPCTEEEANKYYEIKLENTSFVSLPDFHDIKKMNLTRNIVRQLVKSSDLCYVRVGIAAIFVSWYCVKYKKNYVSIVNEDIESNMLVHKSNFVRTVARPLGWLNRLIVSRASYAYYVTRHYLQSRYPNKNGCLGCSDVENLIIDTQVIERRLEKIRCLVGRKIVIGTVGNVEAVLKAHDVIIFALSILKDQGNDKFIYEIVGGGNPKRLDIISKNKKVNDNVVFRGELNHDKVINWMDNIDIYIHPSKSEGLPRTVLEAMSRGVPCICSNVGGIPELLNEEYLISHEKGNPEEQVVNILTRLTEKEMITMAKTNFKKASEYNPSILEKKQRMFFRRIIQECRNNVEGGFN